MKKALSPEFEKLHSSDEQEFYKLIVGYFYGKKDDYSEGYHIIFFAKTDEEYRIKSHQHFNSEIEFYEYRNELYTNQFHFIFMSDEEGLNFIFKGDFLEANEFFNEVKIIADYSFDQDFKNYIEKGIPLPELDFDVKEVLDNMFLRLINSSVDRSKKRLAS